MVLQIHNIKATLLFKDILVTPATVQSLQCSIDDMASSKRPLSTQVEPTFKAKSTITSRLRENEGKFIRQLEQKDQEIMELRKKVQEFSEKRQNTQQQRKYFSPTKSNELQKMSNCKHPEKKQLEGMLKTISTEKLQLERKLSQMTVR